MQNKDPDCKNMFIEINTNKQYLYYTQIKF